MSEAVTRQQTRDQLLRAVAEIQPILEATVTEAEVLATLPPATVNIYHNSFLILLPLARMEISGYKLLPN